MKNEELRIKNRNAAGGFFIYLAAAAVFFAYDLGLANVVGTKHDMLAQGKGSDPNICSYCHIPHNAAGEKIWSTWANEAQLTSGPSTSMGNMCYTCHDGTVTNIGQATVFNADLQQHKISVGKDCNMCHTVHDNTNELFMVVPRTQSAATLSPTYCETCHDATMFPGAEHLGNHLAGSEHPYLCTLCHVMHRAEKYTTPTLTNPILLYANTDSAFCDLCHINNSDMTQPTTGGNKHPAILTTAGQWGKVDCESCHDPHQPDDPGRPAILKGTNIDSAFCASCHAEEDETNGPKIGHSHPVGVAFSSPPQDPSKTPAGNAIDDNDRYGLDYPLNSSNLICETCHSVHRKGVDTPLLRISDEGIALCNNCHSDKQ